MWSYNRWFLQLYKVYLYILLQNVPDVEHGSLMYGQIICCLRSLYRVDLYILLQNLPYSGRQFDILRFLGGEGSEGVYPFLTGSESQFFPKKIAPPPLPSRISNITCLGMKGVHVRGQFVA